MENDTVVQYERMNREDGIRLEREFRDSPTYFEYAIEKRLEQCSPQETETVLRIIMELPPERRARYRRVLTIAGLPISLPKYWRPVQSYTCQVFEVEKNSEEWVEIETMFHDSMPNHEIVRLQRSQNLLHLHKFYAETNRIASDCAPPGGPTEHLLFHGTKGLSPATIISSQEGFDPRLANSQNLWGPGAYFAEDASYANMYACRSTSNIRHMMVASVALGACFDFGIRCDPSLRQPPRDVRSAGRFHSVSGITKDSRVYAVFNSNQCLPQYVLSYKERDLE